MYHYKLAQSTQTGNQTVPTHSFTVGLGKSQFDGNETELRNSVDWVGVKAVFLGHMDVIHEPVPACDEELSRNKDTQNRA